MIHRIHKKCGSTAKKTSPNTRRKKEKYCIEGGASNGSFLRLPQRLILQESKKAD